MNKPNTYVDDFNQASEYLRQSIALLSKYKIPPTPHNYQIAYEFVSGKNQALTKDLAQLLKNVPQLDEAKLQNLYEIHFVQDKESMEVIRQELKHIITTLQEECGVSGDKLSNYAKTLDNFIQILDKHESVTETKEETQKVLKETNSIEVSNYHLDIQLSRIVDEVNQLRDELDQVKEEAMTDTLTHIANRKAFDLELEHTIINARNAKQPFCLIMADIDLFKRFNDTYGHLIGDKVLRFVATTIKNHVKGNDMAARYGGEEFGIILPKTNINGAQAIGNQLREAIAQGELKDKKNGGSYGKVTISMGVTQFRANDVSNELIHRADKALYLAKDRGRNRVEVL